ncbi:hypothetical protein JS562_51115, partial [Agrobacterium sp. S2]|nr:hypothetical protein [Agrobacterium sp. S2]
PYEHRAGAAFEALSPGRTSTAIRSRTYLPGIETPSMLASRRGTLTGAAYSLFSSTYNNQSVRNIKIICISSSKPRDL